MKPKISILALTALLILGLSMAQALAARSVTYLGKTTWTATITDSSKSGQIGITFTIAGGISKVGDEFYLFQGYVTPDGDGPFVVSGSGVLIGTNLVFTLAESQEHTSTWRDGGVMHVSIDKTSQNGTFYDLGHDFNTDAGSRTFDQRFTAGSLQCNAPIPLVVSLAPQQLLLLQ